MTPRRIRSCLTAAAWVCIVVILASEAGMVIGYVFSYFVVK